MRIFPFSRPQERLGNVWFAKFSLLIIQFLSSIIHFCWSYTMGVNERNKKKTLKLKVNSTIWPLVIITSLSFDVTRHTGETYLALKNYKIVTKSHNSWSGKLLKTIFIFIHSKGVFEYRLFAENWKLITENTIVK